MDTIFFQIFIQLFLILLNAFFAGSEIALLSLNTAKLRKLDEKHDKVASRLLHLINEPSSFLSTIQVGITLAGFLGSAFASSSFSTYIVDWLIYDLKFTTIPIPILTTLSMIFVTIVLSYFTLVLGELVPKRIAMQKSYEFAKFSSGIIYVISKIMKPVIYLLSISVNGILILLGFDPHADEENISEEEIRLMIDLGGKKGTIQHDEKMWIENVFDFDDTSVKEVMTHVLDVIFINIHDDEEKILKIIQQSGLSRFPVIDEDANDVIGILYARDYLLNQAFNQKKNLKELLKEVYFVPESIHTDDLFKKMQLKKVHIAIVVDEYGETCGIITMEDLLEEIVGNIYDEYDLEEEEEIVEIDKYSYRIDGGISIEELNKQTSILLPESDDYDTVGGFIFSLIQEIPNDDAIFDLTYQNYEIHVDQVKEKRIESCVIKIRS